MKFYRRIWIREQGFPSELYREIVRLRPEALEGDHFRLECQPGDEVAGALAIRIVEMCDQSGVEQSAGGDLGTLGYDVVTHYEIEDLARSPFLKLDTQKRLIRSSDKIQRDSLGRLLLPAAQAKPTIRVASGFLENWLVVSDAVRRLLEAGDFGGIQFIATQLRGRSAHAASFPFWELSSKLKLPRMLNSFRHEPSSGKYFFVSSPPYRNPEPRYREKETSEIGIFDVARTFEQLYGEPEIVVSQRFYQHCLKHSIPLEVRPVRIDPD